MKLLKYEFFKFFSQKKIRNFLLVLFIINVFLVYVEANSYNHSTKNYSIYQKIKQDINSQDKLVYLENKISFYEEFHIYERSLAEPFKSNDEKKFTILELQEFEDFKKSEEYENLDIYESIYLELSNYYKGLASYDNYIDKVTSNVESYQKGMLWEKASKSKKNDIINTLHIYQSLDGLTLEETNYLSLDIFNTRVSPNIIMLIMVLVIGVSVFYGEDKVTIQLIMKKGRIPTAISKFLVLIILITGITILKECFDFLILSILYGFPKFSSVIQSVFSFYESPYHITILEFLILNIAFKILFMNVIGMLYSAIYKITKRPRASLLIMILIFVISSILYFLITDVQKAVAFKYINAYAILIGNHFFSRHISIGTWYNLQTITVITLIVLFLIATLAYFLFQTKKIYNKKQIRIWRGHITLKNTNLFLQEGFKNLYVDKSILLVILIILGQVLYTYSTYNNVTKSFIDQEQQISKVFKQYGGELTEQKKKNLEDTEREYEKRIDVFMQAQIKYENKQLSAEEYDSILQDYYTMVNDKYYFSLVYDKYIEGNQYLIYDKGYRAITAVNTQARSIRDMLFLALSMLLLCYGVFCKEYETEENELYSLTKLGSMSRNRVRILHMLLSSIALVAIYSAFEWILFNSIYPLDDWTAPFSSILKEHELLNISFPFSYNMPLWSYYLGLIVVRVFGVFSFGSVILFLSKMLRNRIQTLFLALSFLLIPFLLYNSGINSALYISVFDMIMGNLYIYQGQFLKILTYVLVDITLLCAIMKNMKLKKLLNRD